MKNDSDVVCEMKSYNETVLVTAGAAYLDIDAYACCVAMAQLMQRKGMNAIAWSNAPCNYSVCDYLRKDAPITASLPAGWDEKTVQFILVDISDPAYLGPEVLPERVVGVIDHHVGFEEYWQSRIGKGCCIEFIGAAATLVYRQWKAAGLLSQMPSVTARLLIAAILDNTLNLTSPVTTQEDRDAFAQLCQRENVGVHWCADYFSQVQDGIEADLKNALFGDIKRVSGNSVLPPLVGQLSVWNVETLLRRLPQIKSWFAEECQSWVLNLIDIHQNCSYFVCDDSAYQKKLAKAFSVSFDAGVAKLPRAYLRKEIIKKTGAANPAPKSDK